MSDYIYQALERGFIGATGGDYIFWDFTRSAEGALLNVLSRVPARRNAISWYLKFFGLQDEIINVVSLPDRIRAAVEAGDL